MTNLSHRITAQGISLHLQQPSGFLDRSSTTLPWSQWLTHAPAASRMALARLSDWALDGRVHVQADAVSIPHAVAVSLTDVQAQSLGLPGAPPLAVHLDHDGTFDQPAFRFALTWRKNFQPVMVVRQGCILTLGQKSYRLGEALYQLCEAADAFNAAPPEQIEQRFLVWARIQPYLEQAGEVQTTPYLKQTRIAHATRFSIHLESGSDGPQISPVLFGPEPHTDLDAIPNEDEQASQPRELLPPRFQKQFAEKRFVAHGEARTRYALGDGWYAVLDESLQTALTELRRVQSAPAEARRQFARNPQAWLKEKLGDALDDAALDALFVVTDEYSQRVIGEGIWEKPTVPWVKLAGNNWLPDELPEVIPVKLAGRDVTLTPQEASTLLADLKTAKSEGLTSVQFRGEALSVTDETIATVEHACAAAIEAAATDEKQQQESKPEKAPDVGQQGLLTASLLHDLTFEAGKSPRVTRIAPDLPASLQTILKPHQERGLEWLQQSYSCGYPGVLLADDMGLGKTLQALSFLVWLRKAQVQAKPLLVVAPTGLLMNWEKEAVLHFAKGALGEPYRAYGKNPVTPDKLRDAPWVLTTYETVRNREKAFAGIAFGAVVFDEMQKLKAPDSLVSKCAQTLNAGFVVGMTGTPVENRLADLWCLMDRIWPGLLGTLKQFSPHYEGPDASAETNQELKDILLKTRNQQPALMLRRMKHEHLPGLPARHSKVEKVSMPTAQAQAYDKVIADSKNQERPGWMLEALQNLRGVCLHPVHPDDSGDIKDDDYIVQSARLSATFKVLDAVHQQKRKALVFVELLAMQDKLAGLIQRRYKLDVLPMIISGEIAGAERQKRVDKFQSEASSFDVMILSPKAGGVGTTLTAANHVIHLSRWWNPAVEDQCSDRVYRIGQTREVHVHCPVALHPSLGEASFDVKLDALLERKRQMSRELLAPPAVTQDEMKELWQSTTAAR